MKLHFCLLVLVLVACSSNKTTKRFNGPEGIVAEVIETGQDPSASNKVRIDLTSKDGSDRVTIFTGTEGSRVKVFFEKRLIIIQYCYPTSYDIKGYVYSVGKNYNYSDIRITAATVESTIAGIRLCQGGIGV
jgi:hypothetical protein